jgi:hydrogenase expression/formation protein HypD
VTESIDGYRDAETVRRLLFEIGRLSPARQIRIMHVCGTHENALCQFGFRDLLPGWLKIVAGPGCPVCVCPATDIDMAVRLATDHGALVTTFGDVVRVPARMTLLDAKARGGDCRVVYGIDDAIRIAVATPERQVVFFAVGFETTSCTTAAALKRGVPDNFSVLCSHRIVPPALEALVAVPGESLDGFILPGHVMAVMGIRDYRPLASRSGIPMAVAGFEPVDMLAAIHFLARHAASAEKPRDRIFNAYGRAVREDGNAVARRIMGEVFEECDATWRGIGTIGRSGFRLRAEFAKQDAEKRFGICPDTSIPDTHPGCLCGEVLLGRVEPEDCPLFRNVCNPDAPLGPCMVAFEGTCHARHRHGQPARGRS